MVRFLILVSLIFTLVYSAHAYDICGDNRCGETETHYNCPDDCLSGSYDLYCDSSRDNVCDQDCYGNDPDCSRDKRMNVNISYTQDRSFVRPIIASIVALIFIMTLVYFIKSYHQQQNKKNQEVFYEQ